MTMGDDHAVRPAWPHAVAEARGIPLAPGRAEEIVRAAGPILATFRALAAELHADDDVHEFRRRLVVAAATADR